VVSVENTSLSFQWDPPADNETGGTIIFYTLSCWAGDEGFEAKLNVIEDITLDEFLPSTTYTCTLSTSTNGGEGPTASVTATTDGEISTLYIGLHVHIDQL